MCDENQADDQNQRKGLGKVLAFVLGGLFGSTLGILFAPLAGKDTREKIRNVSRDVKNRTIDTANTATAATTEKVTDLVSKGKARVNDAAETVKSAVEAGKTAYSEKKSEITDTLSGENSEEESKPTKKKGS
ncbi:MAG: YtxH domain-containing protein [Candidatus Poribacteria bacterium]|nr:YtxH domain-containing protein [Candidatus Poribacteria bacterium]